MSAKDVRFSSDACDRMLRGVAGGDQSGRGAGAQANRQARAEVVVQHIYGGQVVGMVSRGEAPH
jgi:hypothetical protein